MTRFTSHRARFQGDLAGVKVSDLRGLDYDLDNTAERLEEVIKKLDQVEEFFYEYFNVKEKDDYSNGEFDDLVQNERVYYRYSPNVTDELSNDINICKYLEAYASYIINAKDSPRHRQQEYRILTSEEFEKQLKKEMSTDFTIVGGVIDVLDTRPANDYNNLTLRITDKDLNPQKQKNKYGIRSKDQELAIVLNSYNELKEHLKKELRNIQTGEGSSYDLITIRNLLSKINDDMLLSKIMILGIRSQANKLGDESPFNDFSKLDYGNKDHIKYCLKFCPLCDPQPDLMLTHIGYDLKVAIRRLKNSKRIDSIDLEIIECYNAGSYTIRDIAKEISKDVRVVTQRLDKICRRIVEVI